jgi:hypothetical protein
MGCSGSRGVLLLLLLLLLILLLLLLLVLLLLLLILLLLLLLLKKGGHQLVGCITTGSHLIEDLLKHLRKVFRIHSRK